MQRASMSSTNTHKQRLRYAGTRIQLYGVVGNRQGHPRGSPRASAGPPTYTHCPAAIAHPGQEHLHLYKQGRNRPYGAIVTKISNNILPLPRLLGSLPGACGNQLWPRSWQLAACPAATRLCGIGICGVSS
eukprot:scaffold199686_cov17-Tisochrysis_lutea.AAC.2